MTQSQTVLLPVWRGVLHAKIEKGARWSDVEHFVLYALSQSDFTMAELAQKTGLMKVVVVEAITRLMRAGWVEIMETQERISFKASLFGLAVVEKDNLPPIVREITRKLGFVIECLSGAVFPSRNFSLIRDQNVKQILADRENEGEVHLLSRRVMGQDVPGSIEIIDQLLTSRDEQFKSFDRGKSWMNDDWYVKLVITGEEIEGLPDNTPTKLKRLIVGDISAQQSAVSEKIKPQKDFVNNELSWPMHQVEFCHDDLIVGGQNHETILCSALENARYRVIVHSTFINLDRLSEQIDNLV